MSDVNFWGPHAWIFLHSVSFHYPEYPSWKEKTEYAQFYRRIQDVMPCSMCRSHYARWLRDHPIEYHLDNWQSLSRWLVDLHNQVNTRKHTPHFPYEKALKIYRTEEVCGRSGDASRGKYYLWAALFLFLIFSMLFAFLFLRKGGFWKNRKGRAAKRTA